jgi:hypothetical protein
MTQHGDDVTKMERSISKISDSRLEGSMRDPQRSPRVVPGLLKFLIDEHKNRLGIFTQDPKKLKIFWYKHVSSEYKRKREQQLNSKSFLGFAEFDLEE